MAFTAYEFTFNGRSCREFGLILCDFNGSDREGGTHTAGGKPQVETVFRQHRSLLRGVEDEERLSFQLSFGLCPDRMARRQFLDRFEIEAISTWLTGHRDWGWMTIVQDDLSHVRYRCIITELKEISSGWDTYGFTCTVQCDSHYAYTLPQEYKYQCTDTLNIDFFNRSSMNDPYFPSLVIKPLGSGGVSIVNQSLGGIGPAFGNLAYVNGEKLSALPSLAQLRIELDENGVLTNSEGLNLYPVDAANKEYVDDAVANAENGLYSYVDDSIANAGGGVVQINSVVIGPGASVPNPSYASVAVGASAMAAEGYSIAVGKNANASGYGLAVGIGASAHVYSVAIGPNAYAGGSYSIAIGADSDSFSDYGSVAIGIHAYAGSYATASIVIGSNANCNGSYSVVIGPNTMHDKESYDSVIIGFGAAGTYSAHSCVIIGALAKCYRPTSVALGYNAVCHGTYSSAIGPNSFVSMGEDMTMRLGSDALSKLSCAVSLTVTSDIRDKVDVVPVENGATELLEMITPITFHRNPRSLYIDKENLSEEEQEKRNQFGLCEYDRDAHAAGTKKGSRNRVGVSAQQVQAALEAVYGDPSYANIVDDNFHDIDPETIPDGVESQLTVNYEGFIPFLIKAVQELSARVKELEESQK